MSNELASLSRKCVAAAIISVALSVVGEAAHADSAERGKIAFLKHGCWQCHGFEGQGSTATSNGVVLAPDPLPFETFASFVRSTNRSMPPYSEAILSDADLADIYAMLQSVPKTAIYKDIPLLNQ